MISAPPILAVLFPDPPELPADAVAAALRDYHPDLAAATATFAPAADANVASDGPPAATVGRLAWGMHAVTAVTFAAPMPAAAVEVCLRTALLPPELKAEARAHGGHALLYYAGGDADPREQLVAVAAAAGALARFGGIVTLHEEARAAVHSIALLPDDPGEDMLHTLRTLPVPYLYGGFVKMELTDVPGVWVRSFANPRLGLPNLAYHMPDHAAGQGTFRLFAAVAGYLRQTGLALELGEVVRIDDDTHLKVRAPRPEEWWLDSTGPLVVLDPVQLQEG